MICDKCGSMIPDRSATCPMCKSKITPKTAPLISKKSGGGKWIIVILLVAALLAAAFFGWKYFSGGFGTDDPTPSDSGIVPSDPTLPEDTTPTQTQPTQPAQTQPIDTQPPETLPPETLPPETLPPETNPVAAQPVLPDLGAFLGGGITPGEDEPADENGWHLYYRMDIDAGLQAAQEYVALLGDPRFGLTMRPRAENDEKTVLYLNESFYFFDYTGPASVAPMQDQFYRDGYEDVTADVFVWIQQNTRDGYTAISVYYSNDLEMTDLGDRASTADTLSPGGSNDGSDVPDSPDYTSRTPCPYCDDGNCNTCGGDGYLWSSASDKEDRNCTGAYCQNGSCTYCNGNGWVER